MSKATLITNSVKQQRMLAGLTQEQLAEQLRVSRQTVVAIERGKYSPSLEYAFKLSRILDTPIEELFHYPQTQQKENHDSLR